MNNLSDEKTAFFRELLTDCDEGRTEEELRRCLSPALAAIGVTKTRDPGSSRCSRPNRTAN